MDVRKKDMYFKDRPEGVTLMSGLPLPKDEDGVVRGVTFEGCAFHPNCTGVEFVNCEFVDCEGFTYCT